MGAEPQFSRENLDSLFQTEGDEGIPDAVELCCLADSTLEIQSYADQGASDSVPRAVSQAGGEMVIQVVGYALAVTQLLIAMTDFGIPVPATHNVNQLKGLVKGRMTADPVLIRDPDYAPLINPVLGKDLDNDFHSSSSSSAASQGGSPEMWDLEREARLQLLQALSAQDLEKLFQGGFFPNPHPHRHFEPFHIRVARLCISLASELCLDAPSNYISISWTPSYL
ncbi:hypothetical protein B0H13DRAFT_1854689 [Mycena leptocephala]|nr:hypothetical protein B0H13DRAFT_1854689 [Mycena leptocephala]